MPVIGTLVAESIRPEGLVELGLTLRRLHRITVGVPAPDQPQVWTLIDFTCADEDVDAFAAQLAGALSAGSWYCDFATASTKYVVFKDKIFSYHRGSSLGQAEAIAYARSVGVPEAQLDWPG